MKIVNNELKNEKIPIKIINILIVDDNIYNIMALKLLLN